MSNRVWLQFLQRVLSIVIKYGKENLCQMLFVKLIKSSELGWMLNYTTLCFCGHLVWPKMHSHSCWQHDFKPQFCSFLLKCKWGSEYFLMENYKLEVSDLFSLHPNYPPLTWAEYKQKKNAEWKNYLSKLSLLVISGLKRSGDSFTPQTECWF